MKRWLRHVRSPAHADVKNELLVRQLFEAIGNDDVAAVRHLDVDVNCRNFEGDTALMAAVKKGSIDMIDLLLDRGADIDEKSCG